MLRTPNDGSALVSIRPAENSLQFRLRSCSDARVDLLSHSSNVSAVSYYFDIGISSDSSTVLYKWIDGAFRMLMTRVTPGVLSCDVMRDYWVAFNVDNMFVFGTGKNMEHTLLTYTDVTPATVHALSLKSSNKDNEDAEWEFLKSQGEKINSEAFLTAIFFI